MIEISVESFKKEVLDFDGVVVVDFYANWCGPCKKLTPILNELSEEYDNVKIVKLNADGAMEIMKKYKNMSLPHLIAFDNGVIENRQTGFKSRKQVEDFIAAL